MKKIMRLCSFKVLIMALFLLLSGNKADANSCNVSCKFSSCYINCPDPCSVACGCLFGIASCKSEISKPVKTVNRKAIYDFGHYAASIKNAELIDLFETLKNLEADDTYNLVADQYKLKAEQLSKGSKELLEAYLAK